jgi:hypothetical protein
MVPSVVVGFVILLLGKLEVHGAVVEVQAAVLDHEEHGLLALAGAGAGVADEHEGAGRREVAGSSWLRPQTMKPVGVAGSSTRRCLPLGGTSDGRLASFRPGGFGLSGLLGGKHTDQ